VGLTARIGGEESSIEAGPASWDWEFEGVFRARLSLAFGLSAVSNTLVGRERESEAFHPG
jgi:hypothetical protein